MNDVQASLAVFRGARQDFPTKQVCHDLHAVADSKNRHQAAISSSVAEESIWRQRGVFVVNAQGAAGENDSFDGRILLEPSHEAIQSDYCRWKAVLFSQL